MTDQDQRTPVTILTGYLGSGKTTLLNRILSENHGRKIAVIENEFGEVGIDHELVISADEEIFEMNNGCICCNVRGDLIRVLGRLMKRKDRFDHILLETTGLADPGTVAQTFFMDEEIRRKFWIDAVVTLVDAAHVALHLDSSKEVQEQIAFADVLLLNKIDLVTEEEATRLEEKIRSMNAMAKIYRTKNSSIEIDKVLDVGGFDLHRAVAANPQFLEKNDFQKSFGRRGVTISPKSPAGQHEAGISSLSILEEKPVDGEKLNTWLSALLREKGNDIFRMKGVFNLSGQDKRVVFQGVHMTMDAKVDRPWGDDPRKNALVFIGRNLDSEGIERGFRECLV